MKFRRELDMLLCLDSYHTESCSCEQLKDLYGRKVFRCDYPSCEFYTNGFSTALERDKHLTVHCKPYNCSEKDCVFADLGFSSSTDLSKHMDAAHSQRVDGHSNFSITALSQLPKNDIYKILEDCIRDDQVNLVKDLLPLAKIDCIVLEKLADLFTLASRNASGEMVAYLLDAASTDANTTLDLDQALAAAIDGQNFYTTKTLLEHGANVNREVALSEQQEPNPQRSRKYRSRYHVWSHWSMVPIDRAFGLLHTAIAHLLVERYCANLDLFTGFGVINT
jgi:hypothetical protein